MNNGQNNLVLLIISFVSAVVLWVGVMNLANPMVDTYVSVPIEIEVDESEDVKELGYIYTLDDVKNVKVNYRVRSDLASTIKKSGFKAKVNVSNTTNFSESLPINIVVDPEMEKNLNIYSLIPQQVSVHVNNLVTKYLNVKVVTSGLLADNTLVGNIIVSPNGVSVSGVKEDIDKISEARIEVLLDNHNDTFTGKAKIKFYDNDMKEMNKNVNIISSSDSIDYTVFVNHRKKVTLNPVVVGDVIDGCTLNSVVVEPNTIEIIGPRSNIDSIEHLDLPEVDITGVSESKVVETFSPKEILPTGISYIGAESQIDVKVEVSGSARIIIAPKQNVEE